MFSRYRIFGHVEEWLVSRDEVNFKFMTSQPGKQTIAIHIMPNISRGKGNQTMKIGKTFFWKNHRQDVLENIFPELFLKNQNLAYLCMNSLKFYTFVLIVWQVEGYQNIWKLSCGQLAFTSYKAFLKN